jgi:NAD(P)-dependent dehydrogenase (short-subunit alcohol dehydrogenase family)
MKDAPMKDAPMKDPPMKNLAGKVAFITGGGSGVALGQAKAFAAAGMRIVIADIRRDHLDSALAWFRERDLPIHGTQLDITDRAAYAAAADEAERTFGPVQLLCNTAGVSQFGPVQDATFDDWDWQLSVNLGGMINGVQTFVPRMIRHALGAHIVNTASMAGFLPLPGCAIYCTSKFAVRGLSECLQLDLAPVGIGVSVLCPGAVNTNIHEAVLTRPAHLANTGYYGADPAIMQSLKEVIAPGYDPVELGRIVVRAVQANQLYVIPYAEFKAPMQQRLDLALAVIPDPADDPGMAAREAAMAKRRAERAAGAERSRR